MLNLMVERHNKGQSGNAEIAPSSKKRDRIFLDNFGHSGKKDRKKSMISKYK